MKPRLLPLIVALSVAACTPSGAGRDSAATPATRPSPATIASNAPRETLGLHLFTRGRIVKVTEGRERLITEWPSDTAPYSPPIKTKHGFVGLAQARRRLDLWLVDGGRRKKIDREVTQRFAVSAGAETVAYGLPTYQSGGYRTRLVTAGLPDGEEMRTITIGNYSQPVGFIGERVLIIIGDAVSRVALWDPRTAELERIGRYGTAWATDPTARRALLYQGDGQCWDIATWADAFHTLRGHSCELSNPVFSPEGRWIAGIRGPEFGSRYRLAVHSALEAELELRSDPVPGAFQPAWETEGSVLLLARRGDHAVYRCRTDSGNSKCSEVWSGEPGGRYSTWIIPRSTTPIQIARDKGHGFAMWPEHRGKDARSACGAPEPWRSNPHSVAQEFSRQVLGWAEPRPEVDRYEHFGIHALLRRSDGPVVQMWLRPVAPDCWSVTGVARRPDTREEGVSARVVGRRVRLGVLSLGASSADLIVGFNGREVRKVISDPKSASVRLGFRPRGSGYFIMLLRDEGGRVLSAAGALLYPGLIAG